MPRRIERFPEDPQAAKQRQLLQQLAPWLLLYCASSFYASLWISDEFDAPRTILLGFAGVPLCCLFYSYWWLNGTRRAFRSVTLVAWLFALLLTSFAWGHLLLLNSLTTFSANQKVTYLYKDMETDKTINLAMRKGGLGLLYRYRW